MFKEFTGDMVLELCEIERLNAVDENDADLYLATKGYGGLLTLICC